MYRSNIIEAINCYRRLIAFLHNVVVVGCADLIFLGGRMGVRGQQLKDDEIGRLCGMRVPVVEGEEWGGED